MVSNVGGGRVVNGFVEDPSVVIVHFNVFLGCFDLFL